jgi:hypothetical protein
MFVGSPVIKSSRKPCARYLRNICFEVRNSEPKPYLLARDQDFLVEVRSEMVKNKISHKKYVRYFKQDVHPDYVVLEEY